MLFLMRTVLKDLNKGLGRHFPRTPIGQQMESKNRLRNCGSKEEILNVLSSYEVDIYSFHKEFNNNGVKQPTRLI